MLIRCADFETTGLNPADGAGVCEIGWCDLIGLGDPIEWQVTKPFSILVNPGHKIPPEMSAIHHITDAMVAKAPRFGETAAGLLKGPPRALCAHNARFEQAFFTVQVPWICTYRVAVTIAPQAPSHSLQALRYWATLGCDDDLAMPPHRAGPDAYVNAVLLARLLNKTSVEEMLKISAGPVILPRFHFGEHAGKPIAQVPTSYLAWIVEKSKGPWDADVMATAQHYLAERRAADRARGPVNADAVAAAQRAVEGNRP